MSPNIHRPIPIMIPFLVISNLTSLAWITHIIIINIIIIMLIPLLPPL